MTPYQQAHYDAVVANNFEGCSAWPYMDTHKPNSLITVGIGCATSLEEMLTLPFRLGSQTGPAATPEAIRAHYATVSRMTPGQWFTRYRYASCLMLPEDAIRGLVEKRYDAYVPTLHKTFPAFEALPDPAKTALLDMIWGVGAGGLQKYTHLLSSINRPLPDFIGAAHECAEKGEAYARRNTWRAAQLLKAHALAHGKETH